MNKGLRIAVVVVSLLVDRGRAVAAEETADVNLVRLVALLESPAPAEREEADLRLRNLPLAAYPAVERFVAESGDRLPPETTARLADAMRVFKALGAQQRRAAATIDWAAKVVLTAYDANGPADAPGRAEGRRAVELAVRELHDARPSAGLLEARRAAIEARCDHPVFRYYDAVMQLRWLGTDPRAGVAALYAAAAELTAEDSTYPLVMRYFAASRYHAIVARDPSMAPPAAQTSAVRRPRDFYFRFTRDDGIVPGILVDVAASTYQEDGFDWQMKAFPRYEKHLETLGCDAVHRLLFRAFAHRLRAADDLTRMRSNGVPIETEARRERHVAEAVKALEEAGRLDPTHPGVPLERMCLCLQQGDAEEARKWLDRCLAVNPDAYDACSAYAAALPTEERFAFARQLAAGRNYRGRLPFVLVDTHVLLARATTEKRAYWSRPGVWDDVRAVYKDVLLLYPDSAFHRSHYANIAASCEQWAVADAQFKRLGDAPDLSVFGGMASYNYLRKKAARMVAAAAAE